MADFDEDNFYLQAGFDPKSLTMPKLRNIFFQHDITYPSGANKGQLVDIFESKLRPKAKRILAQQARVKRTSMGIQDMASQSSVDQDEDEDELEPEPPVTRRTTRKSSAAPSVTSTRSRTSRRSTRTPATDAGHTEDEAESTTDRRSRYSTATPVPETASESGRSTRGAGRRKARLSDFDPPMPTQVKEEPEEEEDLPTPKGPSPFTMDNPFQSGSSPGEDALTRKPSRKSTKPRPSSRSSNAYIKHEEDTPVVKSQKSRGSSVRLSNGTVKQSRSRTVSVEPGEEFTQEEQDELDSEEEASGHAVMPPRQKKSSASAARTGPLVVLTTILAGIGGWWRQEKISAGYCGLGSSGQVISLSNSNVEMPDWLSGLQPQCEPCPQHAICYPDFEARCEPDFVLKHHPLSLAGLVPLAPTCEPDSEKARKVKAVADRAVEELREQRAKYECGGTDEAGKTVSTPGLSSETLRAKVSARRRKGMTEVEFEELWKGAIGDVMEREEITQEKDGRRAAQHAHSDAVLSSHSLARLPLACLVRRRARVTLAHYRVPAALVALLAVGLAYARSRLRALQSDRARVPDLVRVALDRLATQAALDDAGRASEPHISMVGLRDDLLRDEFSAQRRDRIWGRVRAIVELNANVRAGVREGRAGDISRVWEWIGPLPQIEDSGYESRRTSGRFSLDRAGANRSEESLLSAGDVGGRDMPAIGRSASPAVKKEEDDGARRRWDEGRAVY